MNKAQIKAKIRRKAERDRKKGKISRSPIQKFKLPRKPFKPHRPIGLSAVSKAIKKAFGLILSRRERKYFARDNRVPFRTFYNN